MNRKISTGLSAKSADIHQLYEVSVQQPQVMIGFIEELFDFIERPEPKVLREDFCGTAQLASMWVASESGREAIGVDIDAEVLAYAEEKNRVPLGEIAGLLKLVRGDVFEVTEKADVLLSLNFSHFIYKTRSELMTYLKHAKSCLNDGGMLILDAFGGPGSISPCEDERNFSSFTYIWEQGNYNPLTNEIDCHIHFKFSNGTTIRNAFNYDWRMWSLAEITELLEEIGFCDVTVYFESEDGFIGDPEAIDCDAWVAYIVALND